MSASWQFDDLPRVSTAIRIVIVRHAAEAKKVSGTAALVERILGAQIVSHGGRTGVAALPDLGDSPALLFPGGRTEDWPRPTTLIVLDGTWAQTRHMRSRVPGLGAIPTLSIPAAPVRWRMRRQTLSEGLSTIEALAEALRRLDDAAAADALQDVFERTAERWRVLRRQ